MDSPSPVDIDLTVESSVLSACPSQSVAPPPSFQEPVIPAYGQLITSPLQQPYTPVQQPYTPVQQPFTHVQQPFTPVQQPFTPVQQPITPAQQPINPVQQPITPAQQPITPAQQPITPVQQPITPAQQPITPVQQSLTPVQHLTAPPFIHQPSVTAPPSGTPLLSDSPPPLPPPICNLQPAQSQSPKVTEPLLLNPDVVVCKYPKYRNVSQAGRLAVRLAVESYFGTEMLRQCTVYGLKGNKPLPVEKVEALKQKMLTLFSVSQVEFEALWTKCINAINHRASGLRKKSLMLHA